MTEFLNRLGKLISVKAIIALVLTGVYAYLAITDHIQPDAFENIFILVVGFYFGQSSGSKNDLNRSYAKGYQDSDSINVSST